MRCLRFAIVILVVWKERFPLLKDRRSMFDSMFSSMGIFNINSCRGMDVQVLSQLGKYGSMSHFQGKQ